MMKRGVLIALAAVLVAGMGWVFFSTGAEIASVGKATLQALWTLPVLISIHLVQLLASSVAWRLLFAVPGPGIGVYFRLRLIREGIDSLFPVAQIGGELVGARLLTRRGIAASEAGASVIVDVSLEVVSQALFLLLGVGTLTIAMGDGSSVAWLGPLSGILVMVGGLLLAQRFGLLRLLEMLVDRIGEQFPDLAHLSLTGLHVAAGKFYRRSGALAGATLLHLFAWALGTLETWIILDALGVPASLAKAMVVESLGMAARTAGFAIPGALAVQEGGFALAALSVGLPESAGLSLSLVKRAREVLVGIAGVSLAWLARGFR
jgi:putative membrane protein